jgi:Xaa-Pro aminopeptidase
VDFQRIIKEPGEIALIKKSMQIVERVFKLVRTEIKKPGMTENRLAQFIQTSGLKMGAEDISFPAIVASGINAATPHHVPSGKKLKAGESIIIDFGFKYKNYCSDFTRTVFLKHAPKKLAESYNEVEKAYNESIDFINQREIEGSLPGLPRKAAFKGTAAGDVYQKSVDVLAERHLDKYFIHSLGHGTGLEIHELPNLSPKSKDVLENGMVFSIEPGVYIKNFGGIRIEDLVYLKNGKVKKFINVSTKLTDNII